MTPEQREAHDQIEAAIDALHAAYREDDDPTPGVLTDYVIVAARHSFTPDGDTLTGHGVYTPHHQAAYRTLGLLDSEVTKLRHFFTCHGNG